MPLPVCMGVGELPSDSVSRISDRIVFKLFTKPSRYTVFEYCSIRGKKMFRNIWPDHTLKKYELV